MNLDSRVTFGTEARCRSAALRLVGVLLVAGLGVGGTGAAAAAAHEAAATPAPAGLEQELRSEMAQRQIPGMQVAVIQHGKIVFLRAFGTVDIEHHLPTTNESIFPINSITKAFTGVALMQLVEQGRLDLDAPISKYLEGLPADWRTVTIRQLATHMSGIPEINDPKTDKFIVDTGNPEDSWVKVQTLPMEFPTGSRVSYNQTNYLLLQRIIEKQSGVPFATFVTERQMNAAGMARTAASGFSDTRDIVPNSTRSYTVLRSADSKWTRTEKVYHYYFERAPFLYAAVGIDSTAEEMAHWVIALQAGKLINSKSLQTLWTPGVLNDGSAGEWALGWPVVARPEHPAIMPTGGARSALAVYPRDDLTVIILSNLCGGYPQEFIDKVAAHYIPGMHVAGGS